MLDSVSPLKELEAKNIGFVELPGGVLQGEAHLDSFNVKTPMHGTVVCPKNQ